MNSKRQDLVDHLIKSKLDPRKFTFIGNNCAKAVMSEDGTYPDQSGDKNHPCHKNVRFPGKGRRLDGCNNKRFPGKGRKLGEN